MRVRSLLLLAAALSFSFACGGAQSPQAGIDEGPAVETAEAGEHAAEEAKCRNVGEKTGATTVPVKLQEWAVLPETESAPAGKVHFALNNVGEENHELVVVRAEKAADLPTAKNGAFDEDKVAAGSVIGEVEPFPAKSTCDGTFELAAGKYMLLCNIVDAEHGDGHVHFRLGMRTEFTVV